LHQGSPREGYQENGWDGEVKGVTVYAENGIFIEQFGLASEPGL